MIFIGWLLIGAATLLWYAAFRNLSVTCILTNTLQGKTADCKNKEPGKKG